MTTTQFLKLTTSDVGRIRSLANDIWWAHYPGIISHSQIRYMLAQDYSEDRLASDLASNVEFIGINVDDTLVGFSAFGPVDAGLAKLHKLYLQPSFHGRGIGSMLLRHTEQTALNLGANQMQLQVNKHNIGAVSAYYACGYHWVQSLILHIGNGFFMDDYLLARQLS